MLVNGPNCTINIANRVTAMNFNYRVKVMGTSLQDLINMGFAVNAHDCQPGEYWVIGCGQTSLENKVGQHSLVTVSQYECLRGGI